MDRKDRELHIRDPMPVGQAPDFTFGDPEEDGLFLRNLKKGDRIRIETVSRGGGGLVLDMELVSPSAAAVRVTRVVQKTGFSTKNIGSEAIGVGDGTVYLRSYVYSKKSKTEELKDGWLAVNCTLNLGGGTTMNQPVKAIFVNGILLFPQTSTSRH